jgi:SAM-dependent methyltransferase
MDEKIKAHFDSVAPLRNSWIDRNRFFYEADWRYLRYLIPAGSSVIEIGCGAGHLLASLNPVRGVGIDLSPQMVGRARENFPHLMFVEGDAEDPALYQDLDGPFDYIVISDSIGLFSDCLAALANLRAIADDRTRIIVSYVGQLWQPVLRGAQRLGMKMDDPEQNWLPTDMIENLLNLSDYEVVSREWRILLPKRWLGLGDLINRYLAPLPLIRRFCLRNYTIARLTGARKSQAPSATVVVPCRNEKGNIESAVVRLPKFADDMELIFVEGNSRDGTYDECIRVRDAHPSRDIKVMKQSGIGKGDAVRAAFAAARGDVLIILDADLTVEPEDLPNFYAVIRSGKGEFINGTRMVYPKEDQAMRFLNLAANWMFAKIFSYLLNQRYSDTLCGTKVLYRRDYERIAANRSFFGDFDPFGDFDLLFGAAKLSLKTVEIPIRYRNRTYGTTQISRFSHGWLLLKMVVFAFRKMKAI